MDIGLVNLGVTKGLFDGLEDTTEEILAEFFGTSTSEGSVKVDTLEKRIKEHLKLPQSKYLVALR